MLSRYGFMTVLPVSGIAMGYYGGKVWCSVRVCATPFNNATLHHPLAIFPFPLSRDRRACRSSGW